MTFTVVADCTTLRKIFLKPLNFDWGTAALWSGEGGETVNFGWRAATLWTSSGGHGLTLDFDWRAAVL